MIDKTYTKSYWIKNKSLRHNIAIRSVELFNAITELFKFYISNGLIDTLPEVSKDRQKIEEITRRHNYIVDDGYSLGADGQKTSAKDAIAYYHIYELENTKKAKFYRMKALFTPKSSLEYELDEIKKLEDGYVDQINKHIGDVDMVLFSRSESAFC